MIQILENMHIWYRKNIEKIVLFLIFIVFFGAIIWQIPYVNILFPSYLSLLIIIATAYILFLPTTKNLIKTSFLVILLSFLLVLAGLHTFAEFLGEFLYLLLVFIFINLLKRN